MDLSHFLTKVKTMQSILFTTMAEIPDYTVKPIKRFPKPASISPCVSVFSTKSP